MDTETEQEPKQEPKLSVERMTEKIIQTVKFYGAGTSFVDLKSHIGKPMKGEYILSLPNMPNSILWFDVSDEFIEAVFQAVKSKKVSLRPSVPLIYAMDGMLPSLPVGRARKKDYKEPRWIPVTFSPINTAVAENIQTKPYSQRSTETTFTFACPNCSKTHTGREISAKPFSQVGYLLECGRVTVRMN